MFSLLMINISLSGALSRVFGQIEMLTDIALKGAIVLVIAWLLSCLFYKSSASTRHLVWSLAVISLLSLPVLTVTLPQWRVTLPESMVNRLEKSALLLASMSELQRAPSSALPSVPANASSVSSPSASSAHSQPSASLQGGALPDSPPILSESAVISQSEKAQMLPIRAGAGPTFFLSFAWLLGFVWVVGMMLILARIAAGTWRVWQLVRYACPAEELSWKYLQSEIADALNLKCEVRLLISEEISVPMTAGITRPVVLLPVNAEAMPREWKRIILLHEMAHIRRRDCLTQMLAQISCALYWFNPLTWLAAARLRDERELACDDQVLRCGTRASDYAGCLVEIARLGSVRLPSPAAIGMACSHLESRVRSVLDPAIDRQGLTRQRMITITAIIACLTFSLASFSSGLAAKQQSPKKRTEKRQPNDQKKTDDVLTAEQRRNGVRVDAEQRRKHELHELVEVAPAVSADLVVPVDEIAAEVAVAEVQINSPVDVQSPVTAIVEAPAAPEPLPAAVIADERKLRALSGIAVAPAARSQGQGRSAGSGSSSGQGQTILGIVAAAPSADADWDQDEKKSDRPAALTADDLIGLRMAGVTPEFIEEMHKAGYDNLSVKELRSLKMFGVSGEFIKAAHEWNGGRPAVRELVSLKTAGVNAEYIRSLKGAGYDKLSLRELSRMKMFGVTPEFIQAMKKAGFDKLTAEQLIQLKTFGVSESYLEEMRGAGFDKLTVEQLIRLKQFGISGEYIRKMRAAGLKNVSSSQAIEMKVRGIDTILMKGGQ